MSKAESTPERWRRYAADQAREIWDSLWKNNLWKRILKNVIATTLLVSICLIPGSRDAIGRAGYLGAITTVFAHPGRRFGQMAEALILVLSGTILGVGWSTFGVYLGSLVIKDNAPAAYAIRGAFLAVLVLLHGFLRSRTPRLFIFVLLMVLVSVVTLVSTSKAVTAVGVTQILYPILIAAGCLIIVNLCIFPEFSSSFLGQTTIDTLTDTATALEKAGRYFVQSPGRPLKSQELSDDGSVEKSASDLGSNRNPGQEPSAPQKSIWTNLKHTVTNLLAGNASTSKHDELQTSSNITLSELTGSKSQIRKKFSDCKAAQQECNFEIAVSVLPPRDMKPVSVKAMQLLVANTIAVIGTCESRFALLGSDDDDSDIKKVDSDISDKSETTGGDLNGSKLHKGGKVSRPSSITGAENTELKLVKAKREIEFGDARLLRYLLKRIATPYNDLHLVVARTIEIVTATLAYAYDVSALPSGLRAPKGILLEELDVHAEILQQALLKFDSDAASALEGAAHIQELEGKEPDIMPREEVFLMSSFMLNVRQAATSIEDMLKHCRELVERRENRRGRTRLYAPRIKWSKWLFTGGGDDEAMPEGARKDRRQGSKDEHENHKDDSESVQSNKSLLNSRKQEDLERNTQANANRIKPKAETAHTQQSKSRRTNVPLALRLRGQAANILEALQCSEDLLYAVKLCFAVFLVLWPAFVAPWNPWYSLNRGLWAALQLIIITEVSIGTSVMTFFLRGIGTTLGCLWGWVSVEARGGNPIVCTAMIFVALFPCCYVQLGTQYPKTGQVAIVSICVVALATELETVPGSATENFLKRWIAFMIGGTAALMVEITVMPVKARTRLVESIASALHQINAMEKCIAFGIEEGVKIDIFNPENVSSFENASGKANSALKAAETFLPFCSTEPRIKGSFKGLALIYGEVLFVLHQIVDRMDNMLHLRTAYGSGPLEDLNAEIYPYRRNVAGTITLTLFAIHGALTTKLPLPQFLPSARLAHLRMINRVREVVLQKVSEGQDDHELASKLARQRAVRRKYMAWNASSAAQAEIIEYLEELIDLTKLLVGASEFKNGLLTRPTYNDYAKGADEKDVGAEEDDEESKAEARDELRDAPMEASGLTRRRRGTTVSSKSSSEEVPASLRRIQSRKIEAGLKKKRTNESRDTAVQ